MILTFFSCFLEVVHSNMSRMSTKGEKNMTAACIAFSEKKVHFRWGRKPASGSSVDEADHVAYNRGCRLSSSKICSKGMSKWQIQLRTCLLKQMVAQAADNDYHALGPLLSNWSIPQIAVPLNEERPQDLWRQLEVDFGQSSDPEMMEVTREFDIALATDFCNANEAA